MKKMISDISIKWKIIIAGTVIIIFYGVTMFAYMIPKEYAGYIRLKKEKLQEITQGAISIFEHYSREHQSGKLTLEEAQKGAITTIKAMRWGPENKDYLWINDFHPNMIMHPYRSDLDGKDITDFKDPKGKHLFVEFVKVCKKSGSGYVDYMWQWKDDKNRIVPKVSYVQAYAPWNWIVGTGIYLEDVNEQILDQLIRNAVVFGLIFVLSIIFFLLTSRVITKPIVNMQAGFSLISSGDLTTQINVTHQDEVGRLVIGFNELIQKMRSLIEAVRDITKDLSRASKTMSLSADNMAQTSQSQAASAEEMTATTEEIASGMDSISHGADDQAHSTETLQKIMNELSLIIQQMNNQVDTTAKQAKVIMQEAQSGEKMLNAMNEIMGRINSSSREVTNIVEVINGISEQINLLSLNAAIEAARAGDAGRGFAVVADEISKLADQTASSIKNIDQLIQNNNQEIKSGLGTVKDTVARFKKIIEEVNSIGTMMRDISVFMENQMKTYDQVNSESQKTKTKAEEIKAATDEHKVGVNEISRSISNMNESIQSNTRHAEEIASNAKKINAMAAMLEEKVDYFKV